MKLKNQNANKNKKSLPKPSSKSKSKPKPKAKQFNPLEYLNALIQLTNDSTNLKVKKGKPGQHRDLSSALTAASPGLMEKTISLQKIRCKSSYSQCRKRSTGLSNNNITTSNQNNGSLRQVLNVNLNNYIITQQQQSNNCIKFTSVSSQSGSYENTPYNNQNHQVGQQQIRKCADFKRDKVAYDNKQALGIGEEQIYRTRQQKELNYYAIKIQRAWRGYQTYKVIRKYYKQFKKQRRLQKAVEQQQRRIQFISRNNNTINTSNSKQPVPSMHAYLNHYYDHIDIGDSVNSGNEQLQKTIKFKLARSKGSDKTNKQQQEKDQRLQVERSHGQEQQGEMGLTQRFRRVRECIGGREQGAYLGVDDLDRGKGNSNSEIQQAATIQMQKANKEMTKPQHDIMQHPQETNPPSSNQSTQKKPCSSNTSPLNSSPTLKQSLPHKQKGTYNLTDPNRTNGVDSMIREETQRYNEILELIEKCGSGGNSSVVLLELLARLQQHKVELERRSDSGEQYNSSGGSGVAIYNPLEERHKHHTPQLSKQQRQHTSHITTLPHYNSPQYNHHNYSPQSNSSLLAFQSKDIYRSFQDYDLDSSSSRNNLKDNPNTNNAKQSEQLQSQMKETADRSLLRVKNQLGLRQQQYHQGKCYQKRQQRVTGEKQLFNRYLQLISQQQSRLNIVIGQSQQLTDFIKSNKYYHKHQQPNIYTSSQQQQLQQQHYQQYLSQYPHKLQLEQQDYQPQHDYPPHQPPHSSSSQSSLSQLSYQNNPTTPIFNQHLTLLQLQRQQSIENLNRLLQQSKLTTTCYTQKLAQIQKRFQRQVSKVQTKREKYAKALRQVKKQAIHVQRLLVSTKGQSHHSIRKQHSSGKTITLQPSSLITSYALRKSFSADNIVLKTILKQPLFTTKDINITSNNYRDLNINLTTVQQKTSFTVKEYSQEPIAEGLQPNELQALNQGEESQMLLDGIDHDHKQNHIISTDNHTDIEVVHNIKEVRSSTLIPHSQTNPPQLSTNTPQRHTDPFIAHPPTDPLQSPLDQIHHNHQNNLLKRQPNQRNSQLSPSSSSQYQDQDPIINTESVHELQKSQLSSEANKFLNSQQSEQQQNSLSSEQQPTDNLVQQQACSQTSNVHIHTQTSIVHIHTANERLAQQCSQQLQQLILTQVVNQFLVEVYLNNTLLKLFRPFIQEIFQFTPITDDTILQFLRIQLPRHYPTQQILLNRSNQPLNPTSLQILKLVRDLSFQIPQYDLILPQQTFRLVRKSIQHAYTSKIQAKKHQPMTPNTAITNPQVIQKIHQRQSQKRLKIYKYLQYQRDMRILYMKCVFNCYNQFLIEEKSAKTLMNSRSTIGPGQLELALKQFNIVCDHKDIQGFFAKAFQRVQQLLRAKCMLPVFKTHKDVELFQRQMLNNIKVQIQETEYKWVNYMDDVLEVWYELVGEITQELLLQATLQLSIVRNRRGQISKPSNSQQLHQ